MKKLKTEWKSSKPNCLRLQEDLNQCFQQGFSKNLEISRKGEWASPDPFSLKFSIVLKTPYKTLRDFKLQMLN